MEKKRVNIFLAFGVVMLFLMSSMDSGIGGFIQTKRQDSSVKKSLSTNNGVIASCVIGGVPMKKRISVESCRCLQQLFSALVEANAHDPCGEGTRLLKVRFIELLADSGLVSHDLSVKDLCSLIEPPWSRDALAQRRAHLMSPRSSGDQNNATLLFCSMAGDGWGFVFPPFLLPRPRVFMQWRGFYPNSSVVSVAEMATGRGVIARGTQVGTAYGFIGIGFAFAVPGSPAEFGFLGYSLMTKVQGVDMTWYYANFPPLVMDESPGNGALGVPLSLSELKFTLKDYDFDKMSYSVVTSPDIGSDVKTNVGNGVYSVPVSGLEIQTTYTWTVTASDGIDTTYKTFNFTTVSPAPIVLNPLPRDGDQDVPVDLSHLQFTLKDNQGDAMEYTVQTSPNIGSDHKVGVHNGTYTVPVSGLTNATEYHWFLNVTDGTYWTRKTFSFETVFPFQFNPFDYGWHYRKQITIDHTQVAGDLTNFPVLVSITDPDLRDKAQVDGDDILFMPTGGVAHELNYEVESYDTSTGTLVAWVNITALSSATDTIFYMYYGNQDSLSMENIKGTWDSNYLTVQHMKDITPSKISDSTSHAYTGTKCAVNQPLQSIGKIGKAQYFDGADDCVDFTVPIIPTGPKTISVWMKKDTNNPEETMFASSTGGSWDDSGTSEYYATGYDMKWQIGNGGAPGQFMDVFVPIPDPSQWHLYTMTYDGTTLTVYTDAASPASNTTKSGTETGPTNNLRIGKRPLPSYCPFHGTLDEFKISNVPRSYEYISTEYYNQNSPATFLIVGPEEPHP